VPGRDQTGTRGAVVEGEVVAGVGAAEEGALIMIVVDVLETVTGAAVAE
jgi:hypothetical protein